MPDTPRPSTPTAADLQARLHEVAGRLRQSGAIDVESQQALAELVDELSRALASSSAPTAEVTHLAETTARLAESLHRPQPTEQAFTVRDRLEQAAINAEAHAPVAVGLVRRLLDALSNIGI